MKTIAIVTTAIDRDIRMTRYSLCSRESQQSTPLTETGFKRRQALRLFIQI